MQMKKYLMMMCCTALAMASAFAQQSQNVQVESNGSEASPSLPVAMQFIQDKIRDKATMPGCFVPAPGSCTVTKDPISDVTGDSAKCQFKFSGSWIYAGRIAKVWVTSFAFRDVEKIEVMSVRDFFRPNYSEVNGSDQFVLVMSMSKNDAVHIQCKKGCKQDSREGRLAVMFDDENLANRVAKASLHAVELCGGGAKSEPY
jgi:hypothetical protein